MVAALVLGALTAAPCALYTVHQMVQCCHVHAHRRCRVASGAPLTESMLPVTESVARVVDLGASEDGVGAAEVGDRRWPDAGVCASCDGRAVTIVAINLFTAVAGGLALRARDAHGDACHAALADRNMRIASEISIVVGAATSTWQFIASCVLAREPTDKP